LNAREVDLNRNWDCQWEATAMYREQPVSPGVSAFSEPETRALRDFVASEGIDAVLFYHSAHGSVSVGVCSENTALAQDLGEEVAEATGYRLYRGGSFFPMTGDATGYFNQIGIAAIEIELTDHTNVEWERNLDGILAALGWVAQRP
jgi:g-D-glutamyl-meso-diaminopimelate peptidase